MAEVPKQIGKYAITRQLGKGAMGMVYEGFDPVIERKVAIKTILAEYLEAGEMEEATAPTENMSLRRSTALPTICSGDM